MSTSTRRIRVTSEQLQSDALRAQLFSACCAYGVVEWVHYDEDFNYNTTTVHVQFQKLSSADRLRSDVQQRGHYWQVESEAAAPCVGADVLLSAADVLRVSRLTAALPTFVCAELPSAPASGPAAAAGSPSPTSSGPAFEEKTFQLHGRGTGARGSAAAGAGAAKVSAEQEVALWSGFEMESAAVRHSCLGPYCAVVHFSSAHDANEFLLQYQLGLAEQHGIYAIHAGTAPASALAVALPKMLARHALADCAVEGRVVRGYVVAMPSNTYCVVDAGLYPAADQAGTTTLVNTHTNFLSVSLGDEVLVQLSTGGGLTVAGEGMVGAKLLRVTSAAAFAARRGAAAKTHQQQQQQRGSRTAAPARGQATGAGSLPARQAPSSGSSSGAGSIAGLAGALRHSTGAGAGPVAGAAAKALASKLFQSIQQRKAGGAGADGGSAERICAYPAGLGVYARLLVRVERIGDDGLHARCVDDAENCGYGGPVFIPAALVPAPDGGSAHGWRTFAVVGERMHVALLYMVAVGGSIATMRGVASKKEADLRRTGTATAAAAAGDGEGGPVAVGTSVSAVSMLRLAPGDLGVPAADTCSATFPALLLRPGPRAPAALRQTPLLLPLSDMGPLDPATLSTSPASLTVSDVVSDMARGHYAVVVPCAVYATRQAQRAVAQEQRRTAEVDEVRRRLAAVMGDDILAVLNDDTEGPSLKRRREGG